MSSGLCSADLTWCASAPEGLGSGRGPAPRARPWTLCPSGLGLSETGCRQGLGFGMASGQGGWGVLPAGGAVPRSHLLTAGPLCPVLQERSPSVAVRACGTLGAGWPPGTPENVCI